MNGIEKLSTVRGFLLDMDGTFYLSDRLLEGALRFIDLLREERNSSSFSQTILRNKAVSMLRRSAVWGFPSLKNRSDLGEATALY